jgi:hypothetical protein
MFFVNTLKYVMIRTIMNRHNIQLIKQQIKCTYSDVIVIKTLCCLLESLTTCCYIMSLVVLLRMN